MRKPTLRGVPTSLLFLMLMPLDVSGADSPKDSVSGHDPQEKRESPGEESPEPLIVKYLMSIAKGQPATTASCFDETTAAGKAHSAAVQTLSRVSATYHAARRVAKQKFGEEGATVIDSEFKTGVLPEYMSPAKMQKLIDQKLVVVREGGDRAYARPFGDTIHMHRKDGRWYITPLEDEFTLATLCIPMHFLAKVWIGSFVQVPTFVQQSNSPEELRQKIRKAVDAAEAAANRSIDQAFPEAAKKPEQASETRDSRGNK